MKKRKAVKKLKVAIICGGPSLERGISLNSARSVLDHLEDDTIEIVPFYFDPQKRPYLVSKAQLYSNTPSDFDFKLRSTAKPLTQKGLIAECKKCDIVFPIMHGQMGEDGRIQRMLENENIPFVASSSHACGLAFNKFYTNEMLRGLGFHVLPSLLVKAKDKDAKEHIKDFFKEHQIGRAIVKPATGGSSIGVFSVENISQAFERMDHIFKSHIDNEVVIEPFAQGREFTINILQNDSGEPVALVPTEIETSYENGAIFDFRKKYLPVHGTMYYQPPRFTDMQIAMIQKQAEDIFKQFDMRDFARFDGWLLDDGKIWFSDINPVSGMEQNSFFFQQGARIGLGHRDLLRHVVASACKRHGIVFPAQPRAVTKRKPVNVLFGGPSSERQVSLMSGTNIWLKLRKSKRYEPKPFLLDFDLNVWEVPYSFILNHTVEEVLHTVQNAKMIAGKLEPLLQTIHQKLGIQPKDLHEPFFMPRKYTLVQFIKRSKFVFLGLHGNPGEDGTIQALLEKAKVKYNGPTAAVSKLCMDKYETARTINSWNIDGLHCARQKLIKIVDMKDTDALWQMLQKELDAQTIIVKPRSDGCSSGIFRLFTVDDLAKYVSFAKSGLLTIPAGTFANQKDIVEMPTKKVDELLFENFIETDTISVRGTKLDYKKKTGWVETTVGVFVSGGVLHVMNPSMTIAEGEVLSVEEKFQGGTGVNITPPPEKIVSKKVLALVKKRIGIVARGIGITGYSRIDAFIRTDTGETSIIEINTLPGLTPSTVIYHQALAEHPQLFPTAFLEELIRNKGY